MKLSWKITLLVGTLLIMVVLVGLGSYYGSVELLLTRSASQQEQAEGRTTLQSIDQFFYERLAETQRTASLTVFASALTGRSAAQEAAALDAMKALQEADARVGGIELVDAQGSVRVTTNSPAGYSVSGDPETADAVRRALQGKVGYTDAEQFRRFGGPGVEFFAPVTDARGGVAGTVGIYIPLTAFTHILDNVNAPLVHLVSAKGLEVGNNDHAAPEDILTEDYSGNPTFQSIQGSAGASGTVVGRDLHDSFDAIVSFAREQGYRDFKGNGWILIIEATADSVYGPAQATARNVSLLMLIYFALASALFYIVFYRLVIGRLGLFAADAKKIAEGDWSARVPEDGRDELSDLGRAFNVMAEKLHGEQGGLEEKINEKT
ncbi:MAG: HAMP domain-containing protein, partial [Patescibacteria group bacterium]|nr:HAMP domain-containing protein [Patescibacteria group bacterium]